MNFHRTFLLRSTEMVTIAHIIESRISICSQLNSKYVFISAPKECSLRKNERERETGWEQRAEVEYGGTRKSERNNRKYSTKTKISGLLIDKSIWMAQLLYHHQHRCRRRRRCCRRCCRCMLFFRRPIPYINSIKTMPPPPTTTTIIYGNQSSILPAMPSWKPDLFILPLIRWYNRNAYGAEWK